MIKLTLNNFLVITSLILTDLKLLGIVKAPWLDILLPIHIVLVAHIIVLVFRLRVFRKGYSKKYISK